VYCNIGWLVSGKFGLQAVCWSVCHGLLKNVYSAGWWSCAEGNSLLPH
jgi:hypothetical protein